MRVDAKRRNHASPGTPSLDRPDDCPTIGATEGLWPGAMPPAAPNIHLGSATSTAEFRACFASEPAFRRFYEQALPRVYGYLFRRCGGDPSLAEDLTQATFMEALRTRATFDGRSSALTWLTGIARHKLVDHFRAREREEHRRLQLVVREIEVDGGNAAWRQLDARDELVDALAKLTSMQRAVLVLHYADGLAVNEVAALIGRSTGATESLLGRAREALRDLLRGEEGR